MASHLLRSDLFLGTKHSVRRHNAATKLQEGVVFQIDIPIDILIRTVEDNRVPPDLTLTSAVS